MKLDDAVERLILLQKMISAMERHKHPLLGLGRIVLLNEEDLAALDRLIGTVVTARRAAEEMFCTCNSARHFEDVARSVYEALEIPSASPYPFTSACPFHNRGSLD